MKKKTTKNDEQQPLVTKKLTAIGLTILDTDAPTRDDATTAKRIAKGQPIKSAESLGPDYSVDKRRNARREHSNHFANRAPAKSK